MAFKRVLASIRTMDGPSPVFARALAVAKQGQDTSLMLYHCMKLQTLAEYEDRIVTTSELNSSRVEQAFRERVREAIAHHQAWLEQLGERVRKESVSVRSLVEEGKAGPRIVELAEKWRADLIVLGRTRRSSLADCLFGTVSDHVIHHAKCSLLLVQ